MELDGQLFRNYNELYALIMCCYKDVSLIDAYGRLQKEKRDSYEGVSDISNHFVLLMQKDLALTLWKIYCDCDSNANTVPKFRNDINESLRNSGFLQKQVKTEKAKKSIEDKLNMMRRKFLAHTDMKRDSSKIEICELKEMLDTICSGFNKVCDVIDDDSIVGISKEDIDLQNMICSTELFALYEQN